MYVSVVLQEGAVAVQTQTQHSRCHSFQERRPRTVGKGRRSNSPTGDVSSSNVLLCTSLNASLHTVDLALESVSGV